MGKYRNMVNTGDCIKCHKYWVNTGITVELVSLLETTCSSRAHGRQQLQREQFLPQRWRNVPSHASARGRWHGTLPRGEAGKHRGGSVAAVNPPLFQGSCCEIYWESRAPQRVGPCKLYPFFPSFSSLFQSEGETAAALLGDQSFSRQQRPPRRLLPWLPW